jgi:hypothetical protein
MTMLLAAALAAGGLTGWFAAGQRFPRSVVLPGIWLIAAALGLQVLALWARPMIGIYASAAVMFLASVVLLYVLWLNRHRLGAVIAALGIALNLIAIGTNDGFMPLPVSAIEESPGAGFLTGMLPPRKKGRVTADDDVRLWILSDWIPRPGGGLMSIGDIVLAAGVGIFVWEIFTGRPLMPNGGNVLRQQPQRGLS